MAYDPYKFVNPSFAGAQNANGAARVADIQGEQDFTAKRDYKRDWWKRGILDAAVNGVKGAAIGGLTGGLPGALAGAGTGLATGFAGDALDKSKGYQGAGTSSVQASQLGGLVPLGAAALGKGLSSGVGRDAMRQSGAYTNEMNAARSGLNPTSMATTDVPVSVGADGLEAGLTSGALSSAAPELLEDATSFIPF